MSLKVKYKLVRIFVFLVSSACLLINQVEASPPWGPQDQFHIVVDYLPLWQLSPHKENIDASPVGVYKEVGDVIGQQIEDITVDLLQKKGMKIFSQSAYLGLFLPKGSNIFYGEDGKTIDERVEPRLITSSAIPWETDENQAFLQTAFSLNPVEADKIPVSTKGPYKHYIVLIRTQMNTVSTKSVPGKAFVQELAIATDQALPGVARHSKARMVYFQSSYSYMEIMIWDATERAVVWNDIEHGKRSNANFLDMQTMLSKMLSRVPGFMPPPTPSREESRKLVENATAAWETVYINNSKLTKRKITSMEYNTLREKYSLEEKRQDVCEQKLIRIRNIYNSKKITKDMYQLIYLAQQNRCDLRWKQY